MNLFRVCIQSFNMIISVNYGIVVVLFIHYGMVTIYIWCSLCKKLIKIQKLILRIDKINLWASTDSKTENSKIYAETHFIIITSQSYRMFNYSHCFQWECVCVYVCVCVRLHMSVCLPLWWLSDVIWCDVRCGGVECDIWHNMSHLYRGKWVNYRIGFEIKVHVYKMCS